MNTFSLDKQIIFFKLNISYISFGMYDFFFYVFFFH